LAIVTPSLQTTGGSNFFSMRTHAHGVGQRRHPAQDRLARLRPEEDLLYGIEASLLSIPSALREPQGGTCSMDAIGRSRKWSN
jgi:hypothetical protein